jgi:hypothetical protein
MAVTAITGRLHGSVVHLGPSNEKSAPAASAREAMCITCSWATVSEDHLIDLARGAELLELSFGNDRDSRGVERAGKGVRIASTGNSGDLRRRKGDHLYAPIVTEYNVEIVKIAPGGTDNDDATTPGVPITPFGRLVR